MLTPCRHVERPVEQGLSKCVLVGGVSGAGHHGGGHPDECLGQASAVTWRGVGPLHVDERAGVGIPGARHLVRADGGWQAVGGEELHAASGGCDEAGSEGLGELSCGKRSLVARARNLPLDGISGAASAMTLMPPRCLGWLGLGARRSGEATGAHSETLGPPGSPGQGHLVVLVPALPGAAANIRFGVNEKLAATITPVATNSPPPTAIAPATEAANPTHIATMPAVTSP